MLIASLMGLGLARADDFNFTAALEILDGLKVTEIQQAYWGLIDSPDVVSLLRINHRGGINVNASTVQVLDAGGSKLGRYLIQGSAFKTISVAIENGGSDPDLRFLYPSLKYNDYEAVKYNFDEVDGMQLTNLSPPGPEGKELGVFGTVEIQPGISEGRHEPDFNLTVQYE